MMPSLELPDAMKRACMMPRIEGIYRARAVQERALLVLELHLLPIKLRQPFTILGTHFHKSPCRCRNPDNRRMLYRTILFNR